METKHSLPKRPVGLCIFVMLAIIACPTNGQNPKPAESTALDARQQNLLSGNVRRIRVEIAKIATKEGKFVEGPRVLKEVTTYDVRGTRVDTVSPPVDANEVPGKREYRYDAKGNAIEMTLRSPDGALLAKESYEYQFDQLGNWVKMTTSVAVYEDGKVSFEPTEVTYRTITYFYNQSVANITGNREPQTSPGTRKEISALPKPLKSVTTTTPILQKLTPPPSQTSSYSYDAANMSVDQPLPERNDAPKTVNETVATETANAPPPVAKKITAKRVSEKELRAALVTLPPPEFPMVAELRGRNQRVEVQVVVDENGNVISAHGTSPQEILNDAAEVAAKKAKFAPGKLSDTPSQIFSVITYDFIAAPSPSPATSITNASNDPLAPKPVRVNDGALLPTLNNASMSSLKTDGVATSSGDSYQQGVSLLNQGRFSEAVTELKKFVYQQPDNAPGYVKLGLAYVALKKNEEAVIAFKMAIQVRPDKMDAQSYYLLGTSYNALAKYPEAITALNKAVAIVGGQTLESGDEARDQISPFLIHYHLGVAYFGLTRAHDAMKEFEKAIALNPKAADSYYALALVQLSLGNQKSAEKQMEILKSLNPALAKKLSNIIAGRAILLPSGCRIFPCP